jgi:hypothetical protein
MALGLNKIILAGANNTTNAAGAYFQTVTLSATTVGNVVPAGTYLLFPTANVSITANNGTSITTLMAANVGGVLISDGINVFANATTNATVTLITVDGGEAVSGTFNNK